MAELDRDEMQARLRQVLSRSGALDSLKSQLRTRLLADLFRHSPRAAASAQRTTADRSALQRLADRLVADHLQVRKKKKEEKMRTTMMMMTKKRKGSDVESEACGKFLSIENRKKERKKRERKKERNKDRKKDRSGNHIANHGVMRSADPPSLSLLVYH